MLKSGKPYLYGNVCEDACLNYKAWLQESHRAQSWAPPLLPIHKGACFCFTLAWLLLHCFVDNTKHYSSHSLNLILRQSHASLPAWQVSWSGCQGTKGISILQFGACWIMEQLLKPLLPHLSDVSIRRAVFNNN